MPSHNEEQVVLQCSLCGNLQRKGALKMRLSSEYYTFESNEVERTQPLFISTD